MLCADDTIAVYENDPTSQSSKVLAAIANLDFSIEIVHWKNQIPPQFSIFRLDPLIDQIKLVVRTKAIVEC